MARYKSPRLLFAWMTVLAIPWCLCGCASLDALPVIRQAAPEPPVVKQQSRIEMPPSNPKATVTAVQDFLERTRAYDLEKLDPKPSAVSAVDAIFKPSPPIRNVSAPADRQLDQSEVRELPPAPISRVAVARAASPIPTLALPVVESVSIRVEAPTVESAVKAEESQAANLPLEMSDIAASGVSDGLIRQLEARVGESADFVNEWNLRLAQLALDRAGDVRRLTPGLPADQSAVLSAFLELAIAVRSSVLDPWLGEHDPLDAMERLRVHLIERADPTVRSIALCTRVVTYGVYDEMDADRFVAGRTIPAIVYSEIANTQSELSDDARFVTRLRTRIELLTVDGRSAWHHEEPEIVDRCRRRRKDFFIAQRVNLPPNLPAGDYVLKVYAEDLLSGRAGEATHPLTIQSALTVASGR